jgi:hypothetical protein
MAAEIAPRPAAGTRDARGHGQVPEFCAFSGVMLACLRGPWRRNRPTSSGRPEIINHRELAALGVDPVQDGPAKHDFVRLCSR